MAWLIGIVCIILVVIFWRIFLPLGIIALILAGAVALYFVAQDSSRQREREREERAAQERIERANAATRERLVKGAAIAASAAHKWIVRRETDPASGAAVPRSASVFSDNGLCKLQVEQRMNGQRLTGIYCDALKIAKQDTVEVKFDNRATSDKMQLEQFSGGEDAYISSGPRYGRSGTLAYQEFLRRLTDAQKVALLLPITGVGNHWFTFSLEGAGSALETIGAVSSAFKDPDIFKPIPAAPKINPQARVRRDATKATSESAPTSTAASTPTTSTPMSPATKLPANAELSYTGNSWVCSRGYRRNGNSCDAVQIPANAELSYRGNDWVCSRGYRRSNNSCDAVQIPANAELSYRGDDWVCSRGFRRTGNSCEAVQIPANAELSYRGNDWVCSRGYRRTGNACEAVQIPANAELSYRGSDWVCSRGFRRSGNDCVPVGVPTQ